MTELEFIAWATEQVKALDPESLRFAKIPEPLKISPVYGNADLQFAMMDVPGYSSKRIAKFRAVRFVSGNKVVWEWKFDVIEHL